MVTVSRNGFTRLGKDVARSEPPRWKLVKIRSPYPRVLLTCPSIIFIHGLRGHPQNTWGRGSDEGRDTEREPTPEPTSRLKTFFKRDKSRLRSDRSSPGPSNPQPRPFWPHEFIPHDIPEAIVWTYGYNSEVISGVFTPNNENSVFQHGRDLAGRFEREIKNEHPVIFVAHSLGGIILKEAIRTSKVCQSRTKLIVFLGTPHRGSRAAGWGVTAAKLAHLAFSPNIGLVESLDVNSLALDTIHEEFINIVHDFRLHIHSFQEGRPMATIPGHIEKIVDDFSSRLGLPQAFEKVETLDADHKQMVKCTGREDDRYRTIHGVIQHFIHRSPVEASSARIITNMTASLSLEAGAPQLDTTKTNRVFFCIPFTMNPRFVGRDDILSKISTTLFTKNGYNRLALVGLGGIGKSQIAIQFAFWVEENKPDVSVFWLSALSKAGFEQSCREIATQCDIHQSSTTNDNDATALVQQYLSSEASGKWVLILDNVDDAQILGRPIHSFLPKSRDGLMLFTTRSQEIASDLATSEVIRIPEMSPVEAKGHLEKLLIQKDLIEDEAATEALLRTLTHLPLAITQAAAYINRNSVSIAQYLDLINQADGNMVELLSSEFQDETRYPESANAVVASWLVSFNRISETDTTATRLLSFLAWIEPKAIPQSIFPEDSEIRLYRAIGTLLGYGFLSQRKENGIYDMHSLVHLVTQTWNSNQGENSCTLREATSQIIMVFPSVDWENREVWRQYLPHSLRALQNAATLDHEESYLGHLVGISLNKDRRDQEAIEVLESVVRFRNEALAEDDPSRLASQHVLAVAYQQNGQIKEAVNLLEKVVLIESGLLAEDNPSRLALQRVLAVVYQDNGQIKEAVDLLEKVVLIQSGLLAEDHPSRLASQHALARAYQENGQIKEAVNLLEKVVSIQSGLLAEDDPSRLASHHVLAVAYQQNGQIKEAVNLLEKVVLIESGLLAEDDLSRLVSQRVLAVIYQDNGQIKEAVDLLEKVVLIQSGLLAEDHPSRLASQHALARAYQENRQIKEAISLLEEVVSIRQRTLRKDHPDRLASEENLKSFHQTYRQTRHERPESRKSAYG
ncbi:unnamed protein product [Clonostachys rosea f. rosea IK726]|uniref:Uncharacterized protein n=1 Tax=Clonostachys rosea f. rosea IK726 TaxID=1349383 RepID=A0ACA9UPI4_BIOOC|nr:unnamed protein product [Clonostachys rosea f. rosea IK726]